MGRLSFYGQNPVVLDYPLLGSFDHFPHYGTMHNAGDQQVRGGHLKLNHNDRFDRAEIKAMPHVPPITIFNAIIWTMDKGTIDIAQYGQNLSTVILDLRDWEYKVHKVGTENVVTFHRIF